MLTPDQPVKTTAAETLAVLLKSHRYDGDRYLKVGSSYGGRAAACTCGEVVPSLRHHLAAVLAEHTRQAVDAALEEVERMLPARTEGAERQGTATWPEHDRNIYSLAVEECQAAVREARARTQDGGPS